MEFKKIISAISIFACCATALSACGSSSSTSNADTELCKFKFLKSDDVEISNLKENSYFELNKDEDEFDISNLEFISENPEIATFSYDKTALGSYIYYDIEPISDGETDVYVKCQECGAESEKLHVIVDLPEATDPVEEGSVDESSEEIERTESVSNSDPEPNSSEMVDAIYIRAKEDAVSATADELQEAVDFLKNNTQSYFSGNENMENTMYYGSLLECYYKDTGNEYEKAGFQAMKTVKYVYRGIDSVLDKETHNNLLELQEMVEALPDVQQ